MDQNSRDKPINKFDLFTGLLAIGTAAGFANGFMLGFQVHVGSNKPAFHSFMSVLTWFSIVHTVKEIKNMVFNFFEIEENWISSMFFAGLVWHSLKFKYD